MPEPIAVARASRAITTKSSYLISSNFNCVCHIVVIFSNLGFPVVVLKKVQQWPGSRCLEVNWSPV